MTIDRWIADTAAANPNQCAIEFNGENLSYAAMTDAIDRKVNELQGRGIGHGDRVAWYGLNHPDVFILLFACARLGAIFVPLNWRLAVDEIRQIVANCEPSAIYWLSLIHI